MAVEGKLTGSSHVASEASYQLIEAEVLHWHRLGEVEAVAPVSDAC